MLIPMMPFFGSEMISATHTTRAADTYNAAGEVVPGAITAATVKIIAPQPVKADELEMLEGGERVSDYLKSYTHSTVQTRRGSIPADTITVYGEMYKVVQVENRPIGEFRKFIMRRIDD